MPARTGCPWPEVTGGGRSRLASARRCEAAWRSHRPRTTRCSRRAPLRHRLARHLPDAGGRRADGRCLPVAVLLGRGGRRGDREPHRRGLCVGCACVVGSGLWAAGLPEARLGRAGRRHGGVGRRGDQLGTAPPCEITLGSIAGARLPDAPEHPHRRLDPRFLRRHLHPAASPALGAVSDFALRPRRRRGTQPFRCGHRRA